jgi:hypothetical protein
MRFLGLITSSMPSWVWKSWAPPKCKVFPGLILKIECKEDGKNVVFASFVIKCKSQPLIFFFIAGSLLEFGLI